MLLSSVGANQAEAVEPPAPSAVELEGLLFLVTPRLSTIGGGLFASKGDVSFARPVMGLGFGGDLTGGAQVVAPSLARNSRISPMAWPSFQTLRMVESTCAPSSHRRIQDPPASHPPMPT